LPSVHEYGNAEPHIIVAAYLYDVVEDTDTTMSDVLRRFGEEVAELVDCHRCQKPEPQNARANVGVPARALPCADIIEKLPQHHRARLAICARVPPREARCTGANGQSRGDLLTTLFQQAAALVVIEP
jgi:hypothetical protein